MKIKTAELIDAALDWAVAKCENVDPIRREYRVGRPIKSEIEHGSDNYVGWAPSRIWAHGGPIVDLVIRSLDFEEGGWRALCWGMDGPNRELYSMRGPTPLVAAMRCYVASTLGPEVEVPDELMDWVRRWAELGASEDRAAAHRPRSRA